MQVVQEDCKHDSMLYDRLIVLLVAVHRYARMRASDAKYHSPFSYAAIQAGYVYLGGKMDDITVLVSYVTLPGAKL